MASDSIDNMIENFVGSVRQKTEVDNKEQGALGGFSLSDKPKTEHPKNDSGAAKVLREKALLGWKECFPKSRKEPHWTAWGNFVKEHLEMSRIGKTRLEKIFQSAGLGISDEEKMIVLIPEEAPKEKTFDEILDEMPDVVEEEISEEESVEDAPPNPLKGCGPKTLDCGHTDWYSEEDHRIAREERGHCCAGRMYKAQVDWGVRGLWDPVPEKLRRGHDRFVNAPSQAWDGYCCCPHTGLYIGGIANDCRSNPDGLRCVVHKDAASRNTLDFVVKEK